MIRCAVVLVFMLIVAGCQSERWGPYTSPRVSGQVLAADTHQPLAGVNVNRGGAEPQPNAGSQPKGGELMMRKVPVLTDENGEFVLASQRILSIFRGTGWSQVRLHFTKPGYLPIETNYPVSFGTNSPEASLAIGQVFLQAAPR